MTITKRRVADSRRRRSYFWSLWSFRFCALLAFSFSLVAQAAIAEDELDKQITLNIPDHTRLEDALIEWGTKAGMALSINTPTVEHQTTQGVHGTLRAGTALTMLLRDSGLSYTAEEGTIRVVPSTTLMRSAQREDQSESAAPPYPGTGTQVNDLGAQNVSKDADSRAESSSTARDNHWGELEQIVVTAQKVQERSLDVPMSLTALSGAQLASEQSYRFEDYVGKVPGLTLINYGGLGNQLVIRGLTTGSVSVNSSVATYIDDTPYMAEGVFAGSYLIAPNLDTFDMQRIEVLKGPQGTLYGANALGGLLKYVTNAPDPSGFAATVEAGVSSVYNGGTGSDVHALVNIPLAGSAALRLVGYDTYYPGFIDDPSRGLTGINGTRFTGGRASLLYDPTADFSIRLNALYQDKAWSDWPSEDVNPGTLTPQNGNLIQEHLIGQPGHTTAQLYNVTMNWDAGFAKLLSTTSYYDNKLNAIRDYSTNFGGTFSKILGAPYGAAITNPRVIHGLTEEVRVSSSDDRPLQWQIGGFFTNQSGEGDAGYFPIDATTKMTLFNISSLGIFDSITHYREYAGFANLDYHITPTFDVALGGRYSENSQTYREVANGLLFGSHDFEIPSSENVFTYSGDARWHVTPESMLYARIAEGFVPGGPNDIVPTGAAVVPRSYSSSTTVNYEAGIKSRLLDDHLTVEVSAFYIDWRKIQLSAVVAGFSTYVNGGGAQSDGVEWNFAYVPINGLSFNFNGAYTHAYLTQPTPAVVNGHVGDRLPAVPLWESSASADYAQPLFGNYKGFVGVDWRLTGSRFADFSATGPRQEMPSFNIVDFRVGVETQRCSYTFYVKNLGNKIAINYLLPETLAGGAGPQSASVYTPRTFGITLTARF